MVCDKEFAGRVGEWIIGLYVTRISEGMGMGKVTAYSWILGR
jgi:hypothetical protein